MITMEQIAQKMRKEQIAYTAINKSLSECGNYPSDGFQWKTYIECTFIRLGNRIFSQTATPFENYDMSQKQRQKNKFSGEF